MVGCDKQVAEVDQGMGYGGGALGPLNLKHLDNTVLRGKSFMRAQVLPRFPRELTAC